MIRRVPAPASVAAILVMSAALAAAHAMLERAEPQVGSTLNRAPREVKLWFTANLEPAFSTVRVLDKSGQRVDRGDARVDEANPTLLRLGLSAVTPGTYRVVWRVASVDTHISEGDFTFTVVP